MNENSKIVENLRENLAEIRRKIETAADKSGRKADEIKLIAVSKTHPLETLQAARQAGASIFGENKVQEAEAKIGAIGANAEWHLIGHLQSNKARKAVRLFDMIQTLDSIELAVRLERLCEEENRESLAVLVQVDLGKEAAKNGIDEKDLPALIEVLQNCRRVKFKGLMTIPPYFEDVEKVRPFFCRLREIRDEWQAKGVFGNQIGELSMGMSHDFETAVEEGATLVRVGTAIFGERRKFA
jgi:hypothetical protein